MRAALWKITWQAAAVAMVVWIALAVWQVLTPGTFTTPIEWWLILILFAVHFVPRVLSLSAGLLIKPRRRT